MTKEIDRNIADQCPQKIETELHGSRPSRTAIHTSAVYHCQSPEHASQVLSSNPKGYAYQRDGHPNADVVAEKVRLLHGAERVAMCASGQSAMAAAILSQLKSGDHVLLSNRLYGGSSTLVQEEAVRFGIESTEVDMCDLQATRDAMQTNTRMLVVETISNPTLRVVDLVGLAEIARTNGANKQDKALLLVDNTFATPVVCRPLEWGADLVLESLTKFMNGHGDVMLGALCGREEVWESVPKAVARWGLASSAWDCWLAERGLETLFVRMNAAAKTSQQVASALLELSPAIDRVDYPGLSDHPDHEVSQRQFAQLESQTCFANIVTIHLSGGLDAADRFIRSGQIPYCPSLGEAVTTLSHPVSSSHRNLNDAQLVELGISGGTIRLSIGLESPEYVVEAVKNAIGKH